jgi:hypothetical protein
MIISQKKKKKKKKKKPNKLVIEGSNMPKSLCNAQNAIMIILFELW